jgi:hypothetical protein
VGTEEIGARGDGVNRRCEVPGGRVVHGIIPGARGLKSLARPLRRRGLRMPSCSWCLLCTACG